MDHPSETILARWTVTQCPFTIEYSQGVLTEVRLAVVDAFHALARGGVEIGGLLLGNYRNGRLTITGSAPIECEHAFGPTFTLSAKDVAKLEKQIAAKNSGNLRVAGWYHSHTRSHIHLSEADVSIQRRFFPEPWQVALVLRPHAFEPVRAGFFFREADGAMQSSISYREFDLEVSPVSSAAFTEPPIVDSPTRRVPSFMANAEDAGQEGEPPEPPRREPSKQLEVAPPAFLPPPPARLRRWPALLAVALAVAGGAAGFLTRERWLPPLLSLAGRAPSASPTAPTGTSLGLTATDSDGQLHIRWDRDSAEIRQGTGALLAISDEGAPLQAMGLDLEHLRSGSFIYVRRSGRVDVRLTVHQPGGAYIAEVFTFLGQPPGASGVPNDAARKQQADAAEEAARLKIDLEKQAARTRRLEQTIESMRRQMEDEPPKRAEVQSPNPGKK